MIPKDKVLHLALGALSVGCAVGALTVYALFGPGPCLAYTSTTVGVLYEVQQHYRGEGEPDLLDALATAAPGWVAWALLEFL